MSLPSTSIQPSTPLTGLRHLIECNCVLPQFKNRSPIIYHRFVVFSVLKGENAAVVPSYVQCPNCGIIHRVLEIGKSVIMKKEELGSILTEDELQDKITCQHLKDTLRQYKVDYATWQHAVFVMENKLWGTVIVLTKEELDGMVMGKFLIILGENLSKLDSYEQEVE